MADKIKFAFLLAGGCAGCEMALVDLSENLLDALEHIEVVFWAPTVADVKYKDLEAMADKSIDLAFVDGMVRLSEHEHMVRVLRAKSKILVAFGACASLGGIPGMANIHTNDELFKQAYKDTFSTENPDGVYPQPQYFLDGKYDLTLPAFQDKVRTIQDLVEVDYYVGGCPPHHSFVAKAVEAIVTGNLPPKGSWLTSGKAVCDVCKRNPANEELERLPVETVKRTVDGMPEEKGCLLQHGFVCLGPITQGDCGASCLNVNMPCRGCGGPIPGIKDYGARAVSAIGSILGSEAATDSLLEKFPVLSKLVYRYSLPASRLKSNVR
ncbi:MAG: F420-nonreducing hydrogenase [Deltaproteobacteria bacterium]|nr:F420-nonreducing hydrogenase [Deltaproteobacteria bacterium]